MAEKFRLIMWLTLKKIPVDFRHDFEYIIHLNKTYKSIICHDYFINSSNEVGWKVGH